MSDDNKIEAVKVPASWGSYAAVPCAQPEPAIPTIADLEPAARWACEQRGEDPDHRPYIAFQHHEPQWIPEARRLRELAISLAALKRSGG